MKKSVVPTKSTKNPGQSKRHPSPSSSDSSESDASGSDHDGDGQAAMLAALEAHSRAMLGFSLGKAGPAESSAQGSSESESEGDSSNPVMVDSDDEDEYFTDDGWGAEDGFVTDSEDEFAAPPAKKTGSRAKSKAKRECGRSQSLAGC